MMLYDSHIDNWFNVLNHAELITHMAIQRKKQGLHVSIIAILNLKVSLLNGKEANLNNTCCAIPMDRFTATVLLSSH